MENRQLAIETLNDLTALHNDRIAGYEKAMKEVENDHQDLKPFFLNRIAESRRLKLELGTEVEVLGKDMEVDTTAKGKLHRAWIELKETFTGHSAKSLLEECEFGEDAIKKAYEEAVSNVDLPAYIRETLNAQLSVLLEAHDEVKSLRDTVQ